MDFKTTISKKSRLWLKFLAAIITIVFLKKHFLSKTPGKFKKNIQ